MHTLLRTPRVRNGTQSLRPRILLAEDSPAYARMLSGTIGQQLGLPVDVVSNLAGARAAMNARDDWFMTLTSPVLGDGSHDRVMDFFLERQLPTVVVSDAYDEDPRRQVLGGCVIDYVLKHAPGSVDYLVWLVRRLERNRRIGALVVDDPASAHGASASLLALYGFRVTEAASGEAALAALDADPGIRLAVVSQEMPDMKGDEFTHRLRVRHARDRLAIIGISGSHDASLIPRFLKNGANDFLHKPFSPEEFLCRVSQNIDQLELIGTLQELATRDGLTGLPNRRHFLSECEALPPRTLGRQQAVTSAIVDIDHFKHVNHRWGHDTGDRALRAVAHAVARHADDTGLVARFGGEEFCLLVPRLGETEVLEYLEILRQRIEALEVDTDNGDVLRMTVSIGAFRTRFPRTTLNQLLGQADRRLYLAKAGGRNRVVAYD